MKKGVAFLLIFAGFILLLIFLLQFAEIKYGGRLIAILFPGGNIALKERDLLLIIQGLMLLVVIPVYILTFIFSWKYRAQNKKAKYTPEWDDNRLAEFIWWGVPFILIVFIGVLTVIRTRELDPFKPLKPHEESMKIQVVALQWKWLFLYPEEKIAVMNYLPIPVNTPIHFEITADAPMNSFWIPQLGSQIYAMPNMKTSLHLIADETGKFRGSSANLSGKGFAGMHFITEATPVEDFNQWIKEAKQSSHVLDWENYVQLALPSENDPITTYQLKEENLLERIINKYRYPQQE